MIGVTQRRTLRLVWHYGNVKRRHSDALSPENKRYCVLLRPPRFIKAAGVSVTAMHDPWDYSGTQTCIR